MSLCINPQCTQPISSEEQLFCQTCGSDLLLAGQYRVVRLLSNKGAFSTTYEVKKSRTSYVLKVLTSNQEKAVKLFKQESEVLCELFHPGIPRGRGYFPYFPRNSKTPIHCLIMEKVEGIDLEEYLKRRQYQPITQYVAIDWLLQLAWILHTVHSRQFFHRDIKPSNIILRPNSQLTLIDFGAARQITGTILSGSSNTGIYTPGYAPPEQEKGFSVQQSDFYALGRTFVFLLTGKQPNDLTMYFPATDELHWRGHVPHLLPEFGDFLDQLMARRASDRPMNTEAILEILNILQKEITSISNPLTIPETKVANPIDSPPAATELIDSTPETTPESGGSKTPWYQRRWF